ncbi:MAG TPA: plasmid pRiA4b ORF-3 family protein [Chloroflexi bacterium]|nr:plasmid pRiA4b ORF-3 family protein [Chloroflexota bacterium]
MAKRKNPRRKKAAEPTQVYQIKINLKGAKPPIWRRVLVTDATTLAQMHDIIQTAMGWDDYHLHQFTVGGRYFGRSSPEDFYPMQDERKYTLRQIVTGVKFKFLYEYDFGDGWEHELLVEKILPLDPESDYPRCIKGKRACPPEDVGGVWGYEGFVEAIKNPKHPEHEDMLEWVGEFDPEAFDLDEVNARLKYTR